MGAMGIVVRACAPPAPAAAAPSGSRDAAQAQRRSKPSRTARVLVLGGTGRVGGSTATALSRLRPDLGILVGGRNREKGESVAAKLGGQSEFVHVDTRDAGMLEQALQGVDLVVHTAGPFQRAEECTVLQAAISTKTPYIDVCDDTDYSWRTKGFHEQAKAAGVPAITTAGIYPGVSNVMAAELVHAARSENGEPERLRFFYYTAGTGGAGPTILATSFLLLGEDVIAYNKGTSSLCTSAIAPMEFLTEFLRDRNKVQKLVQSVDPLVRTVDGIAGERVSMRVDLDCSNGRNTIGLFTHKKLSVSVGFATAAFALAVLEGNTQPGVWFPEEPEGIPIEARKLLLERASQGTSNFVMNKPSWMVETDPKEVGLGIYV
ncbi:uncharacterized protein [Miscanthus floridulus]|uniref:uncharacterized protein isoform X2 n=1 Tax=Miscanthus floridulus TaxID=154761 RepID=UPI003458503D